MTAVRVGAGRARPVASSFLICGMPRSGTAFLAGLLASTRLVGLAREQFDRAKEPAGVRADYPAFIAETIATQSRRGVFGTKFVGEQLWEFVATLRSLTEDGSLSDAALIEQALPRPRYIWLRRRDIVAQAVSLWKGHRTGQWWLDSHSRPRPAAVPTIDLGEIDRWHGEIVRGNEAWERWFGEHGIEPFRVVYEELDAHRVDVTKRVLEFLEIPAPDNVRINEQTARQSDTFNDEAIAAYRGHLASRGPEVAAASTSKPTPT